MIKSSRYKVAIVLGLILLPLVLVCQEPTNEANEERIMPLRNLTVPKVSVTLDLESDQPKARLTATLENPGDRNIETQITLPKAIKKNVAVMARSQQKIEWEGPVEVKQTARFTHSVQFSPLLKIEEIKEFKPVAQIDVDVLMPKGAKKLIWSNKELVPGARTSDNRQTYKWSGANQFATTLALIWTTSNTDIEIKKSIQPDWVNRKVLVLLTVRNKGTTPVENIVLEDDFPVHDYEGIANGSQGQFEIYKGNENDQRLLWKYRLPTIMAGGHEVVKFYLKLKYDLQQIRLYETRALEGGEPIAFSKSVLINKN